MSNSNGSNPNSRLNNGGLTADEERWLAAGGVGAICGPYESENRYWPSLWMALGFLAFVGFESLMDFCRMMSHCFFVSTPTVATCSMYSALYGISLTLAYQLASGRLEQLADRLVHRYSDRRKLLTDLLVAMAFLVLSPLVLQMVAISYRDPRLSSALEILTASNLIVVVYRSVPWLVCIWILAYLLPRKGSKAARSLQLSTFGLDDAIAAWCARLLAGESVDEEDALELEEHLREEVTALIQGGLLEPQAFAVACRRMGGQEDLSREFAKAQPEVVWRTRARWMLMGVLMMFMFRVVQTTIQLLPLWGLKLGAPPPVDPMVLYRLSEVAIWACGIYLFARFADGGLARLAEWLSRRHGNPRALATDLAFLIAVFIGAQMLWIVAWGPGEVPLSDVTIVFVNKGLPVLLLTCAGIYWLHPRKAQRRLGV